MTSAVADTVCGVGFWVRDTAVAATLMGWVGKNLCVTAIALSGKTALFRCRRYRVLSSGRKETVVLPTNGVRRQNGFINVGGWRKERNCSPLLAERREAEN